MKWLRALYAIIILLVLAGVAWLVMEWRNSEPVERAVIHKGKVKDIQDMARLCTLEIYDDVPVKGHVGSRHLFGRMRLEGRVSFDLSEADIHLDGDTLRINLPREIVDVRESTDPDAYRVIDTWNDRLLGSDQFTAREENRLKELVRASWVNRIYANGSIRRARKEARHNIAEMTAIMTGHPVVVVDSFPSGRRR